MVSHVFNFNVGVLGHVDSGKTSLSKALSTTASTACFDKNPQSKERGITLDLGFSSFQVDFPAHLADSLTSRYTTDGQLQYTLVDCPGHASLIRTIIGGAQIIDLMMLVVDVNKGVQTQTAECLVIGEITCNKMVVVLNKIDMIPEEKRATSIEKMKKKLSKTLENTVFSGCPMVAVSAKPGGSESSETDTVGIEELVDVLKANTYIPIRNPTGPFMFAVDHCFSIRGQGTVMTGTVLSGSVAINDTVEIPTLKLQKKVKSIQMFKKPADKVIQGDRAGICVTQFDPKQLERGLVCSVGDLPTIYGGIISVEKIPYFKGNIMTKSKFHITMGHETVMGKVSFFGLYESESKTDSNVSSEKLTLDFSHDYVYQDELIARPAKKAQSNSGTECEANNIMYPVKQFAVLELEKPVTCSKTSLVIGSKLDADIHSNMCRIGFHGILLEIFTDLKFTETVLPKLKVYKTKHKEGVVERVMDEYTLICKNIFKKETNLQLFSGMKIALSSGEPGVIEGGFGQSGKIKIRIPNGLKQTTMQLLPVSKGKGKSKGDGSKTEGNSTDHQQVKVILEFKRYIYDPQKKMKQS